MKKVVFISTSILLGILFLGPFFAFLVPPAIETELFLNEVTPRQVKITDLTPSTPIIIGNDSEFLGHGFLGDGSEASPYLIEDLSIIDTVNPYGITVQNTTKHFIIRNCYIEVDGEGIRIQNVSDGTAFISGNQLMGCDSDGIVIVSADYTIVANNVGTEDHVGLRIAKSTGVYAYNNTFIGGSPSGYICSSGIYPSDSSLIFLVNNTIDDFNRGIYTNNIDSSFIANNTILSSKEFGGIYLGDNSDDNYILNNTILSNSVNDGIRLYNSDNNEISYNTIKNNNDYGCNLQFNSENNLIHHNNFIDNNLGSSQAYTLSSSNIWYDSSSEQGNYWSDLGASSQYLITGVTSYDIYPLDSPAMISWADFILPYDDVYETNNYFEEAADITIDSTIESLIAYENDYYHINLDREAIITVTLSFNSYHANLDLLLLDKDGNLLTESSTNDNSESITFACFYSGDYYIYVKVQSMVRFYTDYSITTSTTPQALTDDAYEDNENLESATQIPIDQTLDLIYKDPDFFTFKLNFSNIISITIEFDNLLCDLDLYLLPENYNGTTNEILAKSEGTESSESLLYTALYEGDYYVQIICNDESFTATNYTLTTTLETLTSQASFLSLTLIAPFFTTISLIMIITRKRK